MIYSKITGNVFSRALHSLKDQLPEPLWGELAQLAESGKFHDSRKVLKSIRDFCDRAEAQASDADR
jgi:hypothetical protein